MADSSGNGYTGTLQGGAAWTTDRFGSSGKAVVLDGSNGYVLASSQDIVACPGPQRDFAISVWFKPSSTWTVTSHPNSALLTRGSSVTDWGIFLASDSALYFWWIDAVPAITKTTTARWDAGRWYHLAVTYNSVLKQLSVWVDGQREQAVTMTDDVGRKSGTEVRMGWYSSGTVGAAFDDVMLFDRSLSDGDILAFNCGVDLSFEDPNDADTTPEAFEDFTGNGTPDAFEDDPGDADTIPEAFEDLDTNGKPDGFEDKNTNGVPDFFETVRPGAVTSPSHPVAAFWYNQPSFGVAWATDRFPGATGWLWRVDEAMATVVTLANGQWEPLATTTLTMPGQPHGEHWFHVAPLDDNGSPVAIQQSEFRFSVNTRAPAVSSSTHPDPAQAYAPTNVGLSWTNPDVSTGSMVRHYCAFDKTPVHVPTKTDASTISQARNYLGIAQGSYYFHVVSEDRAGNLSPAAHFRVNVGIIEAPPPVAAFSASPLTGTIPLQVTFTDQSTGEITTRQWDFDGNGTIDVTNPAAPIRWTYTAARTYTARLTVTGPGGTDVEEKTGLVTASLPPPPVAAFSATPVSGVVPLEVTFTDQSTGNITARTWDFGDGTPAANNPTAPIRHTYAQVGTYTVSLTATGPGGSDAEVKPDLVTVAPRVNHRPVARVTSALITPTQAGSEVVLDGTPSSDPDDDALTYYWREMLDNPALTLIDRLSKTTTVEPPMRGVYRYQLVVQDTQGLQSTPVEVAVRVPGLVGTVFVSGTNHLVRLSGARVTAQGQTVEDDTDPYGQFALLIQATTSVLNVYANKEQYHETVSNTTASSPSSPPVVLDIEALRTNRWEGRVLDAETWEGIGGVRLDLMPGGQYVTDTQQGQPGSQTRGAFALPEPPPGAHQVVLSHPGYAPETPLLWFPDTVQPRVFTLTPLSAGTIRRIYGHVCATGTTIPLAGVQVEIEGVLDGSGQPYVTNTGGDGAYTLPGVPVGAYRVVASVPVGQAPDESFRPSVQRVIVTAAQDALCDIEMGGGVFGFFGEITGPDGELIPGAHLEYIGPGWTTSREGPAGPLFPHEIIHAGRGTRSATDRPVVADGLSDETGYFALQLPQGTRQVKVSAPGYAAQWLEVSLDGHLRQTVVLERGAEPGFDIPLQPGWNLVSVSATRAVPEDADIVGTIWYWDAASQAYRAVGDGELLLAGRGYWVYSAR